MMCGIKPKKSYRIKLGGVIYCIYAAHSLAGNIRRADAKLKNIDCLHVYKEEKICYDAFLSMVERIIGLLFTQVLNTSSYYTTPPEVDTYAPQLSYA